MSSAVTQSQLLIWFKIKEAISGGPAGVDYDSLFEELDQFLQLDGSSTPAVSMLGLYRTAISGGTYNIDLTALQTRGGTADASGKKLIALMMFNPVGSAAFSQVAAGGSNGYVLANAVKVYPGGYNMAYQAGQLAAVDSTHKNLTVTATNGDVPFIALLLG